MVCAYLWMMKQYGRPDLWSVIVHENGKYPLGPTIFYTSHFCREWPVKSVYIAVAWILFRAYNPAWDPAPERRGTGRRIGLAAAAATGILVIAAFASAVSRTDWTTAWHDLLQFRTNDTALPVWGSHWRFHFMSGIAFCGGAGLIAAFAASRFIQETSTRSRSVQPSRLFRHLVPAAMVFLGASIFFLLGLDSFTDPRFLGHQMRESTGTDLPVALPLLMGTFLFWDRWLRRGGKSAAPPAAPSSAPSDVREILGWCAIALLPVALNALLLKNVDIGAHLQDLPGAKGWSIPDLYAWHVFEHTLDYLYYMLVGSAVCLLSTRAFDSNRASATT